VESHIDPGFRKCYLALPKEVRRTAHSDYLLWKKDPFANGLHFKEVNKKDCLWSVRAGAGYRALGTKEGNKVMVQLELLSA
jgi:hypothetical protein